jgi:hypothetical protein
MDKLKNVKNNILTSEKRINDAKAQYMNKLGI